MARFFVDAAMKYMSFSSSFVVGIVPLSGTALWPRMMLVRSTLAGTAGHRGEARAWYDKVPSLWAKADPEMQPAVARIRAA